MTSNRDAGVAGATMDSHTSHEGNHLRAQKSAWEAVAKIFEIFKDTPYGQGSLFDATTFVVTSEFSRTPFLNGAKGKDHNVHTNSVLVCGPSIRTGKVVGGSRVIPPQKGASYLTTRHVARPMNFSTGRALTTEEMVAYAGTNRDVRLIFPEDVMATVTEAAFGSQGQGVVRGRVLRSLLKA